MARNDKLVQVDGAAIEQRRIALGMTREAFAAEAGITANTLLAVERAYRDPAERTANKITTALDRLETERTAPMPDVTIPGPMVDRLFAELAALRSAVEALEADRRARQ